MTIESYITPVDSQRLASAAQPVERYTALVAAAQAAVASAEEAAISSLTDRTLARAKAARGELEDAERGLDLARLAEGKVAAEVAANETAAIRAEIARRESCEPLLLVDDEARELAVEVGMLSARLHTLVVGRQASIYEAHDALSDLRRRVGAQAPDRPSSRVDAALTDLVRLSWAAQKSSGWEGGCGHFANAMFVARLGSSTSMGSVAAELGGEVDRLRKRVSARTTPAKTSAALAATAAVVAMAVLSAITLVGGGS